MLGESRVLASKAGIQPNGEQDMALCVCVAFAQEFREGCDTKSMTLETSDASIAGSSSEHSEANSKTTEKFIPNLHHFRSCTNFILHRQQQLLTLRSSQSRS